MQNNKIIDFSIKLKTNILFILFFNIYAPPNHKTIPNHEMQVMQQSSCANMAAALSCNQITSEQLNMKKILAHYNHPSARAFIAQTFSLIDAAKAFNININQKLINTYLRTSDNYHRWDTPSVLIDLLLLNNTQKKKEIFEAKLLEDKWNIFLTSFLEYISDNAFDNSCCMNKELTEATKNFTYAIINKNSTQALNDLNEMKKHFFKQEKINIPNCNQAIEKYNMNDQVNQLFEYHYKNNCSNKIMFMITAYQILGNLFNPHTTDEVTAFSYFWPLFLIGFRVVIIIGAFSLGAYFILNTHSTSQSVSNIIQFFSNISYSNAFMNFYDLSCEIGCPTTPITPATTPAPAALVTLAPPAPAPLASPAPAPAPIPT